MRSSLLLWVVWTTWIVTVYAFEHEHSPVQFLEYNPSVIENHKSRNKPFYLLFSAQWCHWCKIFASKTLVDPEVYTFLNENFVNIFIDADIHPTVFQKFKATGWPYTVFLNPDTRVHYQYAGTVYPRDFVKVLYEVKKNIDERRAIPGFESMAYEYDPPKELAKDRVQSFQDLFLQTVRENFDLSEGGIGREAKAIFPHTLIYLLDETDVENRAEVLQSIHLTLKKAILHIYDPIEGGFFRYAEKRKWQIPHYEKMADLNAGNILLLYRMARETNDAELKEVADQTLQYLTTTLFDFQTGIFLSFQEADTEYYYFDAWQRKTKKPPLVIQKAFINRVAPALDYLIDVLEYTGEFALEQKIKQSLNFLASMIWQKEQIPHYYSLSENQWKGESRLPNFAHLAYLFQKAATRFDNPYYEETALKVLELTKKRFFNRDLRIFTDNYSQDWNDIEYHMELNGILAQILLQTQTVSHRRAAVGMLRYFLAMDEYLEEQAWDARDWEFLERYVPYLKALDLYDEKVVN